MYKVYMLQTLVMCTPLNQKTNSSIYLSHSGSVSTAFSTDQLVLGGICQSTENRLVVTMSDSESKIYQPNSQSRRLIRHVTVTGDVIHEYEYQEDGHTRLFTLPSRVRQSGNTDIDICEVKVKSVTSSELVMLSLS